MYDNTAIDLNKCGAITVFSCMQIAADNAVFGQTGPKVGSFDAGYGSSQMVRLIGGLHEQPGVGLPAFPCLSVAVFDNTHNLLFKSLTVSSQLLFAADYGSAKVLWLTACLLVYIWLYLSVLSQPVMTR